MSDQVIATGQAVMATQLPSAARAELAAAAARLQGGSGILVRMADLMGGAMGRSVRLGARTLGMAPGLQEKLRGLASVALRRAFDVAILRMNGPPPPREVTRTVVLLSGAVGGFLGLAGFIPDVTVTTLAIMRSIARIAQEEGEDLTEEDTRRACLEVFGLAPGETEAESELGYFSARLMMQGRPVVLLIGEVAGRYGVSLSQKFALQAVPIVGALSGAALNSAFLRHYRDAARAHFVIRRLERVYGVDLVRHTWTAMRTA